MTLNICLQSHFVNVVKTYGTGTSSFRDNVSPDYKHCYFLESGELFSLTNVPICALQYKNIKCNNINHFKDIDIFYNNIIESLITGAWNAIPVGGAFSIGKLPLVVTVSYQTEIAL